MKLLSKMLLFVCLAIACAPKAPQSTTPNVLAFVNGETIFESQLTARISLEKSSYSEKNLSDRKIFENLKSELLTDIVQNKAIASWGHKNNIVLSQEEIAEGIQGIKKGYTDKSFEAFLSDKGIPFVIWRSMAEEKLLVKKILQQEVYSKIQITPKEVGQHYGSHIKDYKIEESVRARHIVTDSEEKAKKILTLLLEGENFAKVAILNSLSPDRANGGDLGYFERGTHPEIFDTTCFGLKPGQLSKIVKSDYGYHIFKLVNKKPARTKTLEEASTEIYSELVKNKMTTTYQIWLESILKESQIQVIEENLKKVKFESIL